MKQHYPAYTRLCKGLGVLLFLMALLFAAPAHAGALQDRQQELEPLFDAPCARYQVPKVLALAIARQESGCHPWILNISGRDVRPRSKEEALRYAQWAMLAGRSFDVGIMQVNSYWIRKHGWSLEQVLEPANNVKIGRLDPGPGDPAPRPQLAGRSLLPYAASS